MFIIISVIKLGNLNSTEGLENYASAGAPSLTLASCDRNLNSTEPWTRESQRSSFHPRPTDHLRQFAAQSVQSFSKYRVHKITICMVARQQKDERKKGWPDRKRPSIGRVGSGLLYNWLLQVSLIGYPHCQSCECNLSNMYVILPDVRCL